MTRTRRWLLILLVVFLVYAVIHDPVDSASNVRWLWDQLLNGFQAVGRFFDQLIAS